MLFYVILCYCMLFKLLCCFVLFYVILCYFMLFYNFGYNFGYNYLLSGVDQNVNTLVSALILRCFFHVRPKRLGELARTRKVQDGRPAGQVQSIGCCLWYVSDWSTICGMPLASAWKVCCNTEVIDQVSVWANSSCSNLFLVGICEHRKMKTLE